MNTSGVGRPQMYLPCWGDEHGGSKGRLGSGGSAAGGAIPVVCRSPGAVAGGV